MKNRQTHMYFIRTSELLGGDDTIVSELRERALEEDLTSFFLSDTQTRFASIPAVPLLIC